MKIISKLRRYCRAETGVAAIEFALILPFMLLLYFGLLDLTGLISANRKMTSTASIVADLVGQSTNTIAASKVSDYILVSGMINNPAPDSGVTVRITNYMRSGGAAVQRWTRTNTGGPGCPAVNTGSIPGLMTANNDIIVAQACMTYKPFVANWLGTSILGASALSVQQDIMVRPRSSLTLDLVP